MRAKVEVQIVLDVEGVKCIRIVGSPEEHLNIVIMRFRSDLKKMGTNNISKP